MITALVLASLAAAPARFALVVTYNGGTELSRPMLHYADDDGAKYFEVFAALDRPENVELLTEFDADSARLFPALSKLARPPTEANIREQAAAIAARVRTAKAQGRATELTFVFAGHGDVEGGRGFISIKGGRLDGDALTDILGVVGADRSHVILDSCNSFFVLSPRGPGRRYATSADISEKLTRQLPNVGVFLSTNAEAEVFEWSQLQSGVFSHAVRSGLLGAADADGDGRVSYQELEAFVDRATQDVKNPLFRPKVFSRGPGGDDAAAVIDLHDTQTVPLRVDDSGDVRLSIRDRQGLRWIDAHKEAGASLVLRLPAFLAADGTVERLGAGAQDRTSSVALADGAGLPLLLSALGGGAPAPEARGMNEFMEGLFQEPFGPVAFASFEKARAEQPAQVFGIGTREKARTQLLMGEVNGLGRSNRLFLGTLALAGSGVLACVGAAALANQPEADSLKLAGGAFAWSGILAVAGIVRFSLFTEEEDIARRFGKDLANPALDPEQVIGRASESLARIAERDRQQRQRLWALSWVLSGAGAVLVPVAIVGYRNANSATSRTSYEVLGIVGGGIVVVGALTAVMSRLTELPIDRLERLWREDPDRLSATGLSVMSLSISPVDGRGATFGLAGRF